MSCRLWNERQLDPRDRGFLCARTHGRLSNLRWHHPPFISGRRVGPCHLLSSFSSQPQRREERQRKEKANRQTHVRPGFTETVCQTLLIVAPPPTRSDTILSHQAKNFYHLPERRPVFSCSFLGKLRPSAVLVFFIFFIVPGGGGSFVKCIPDCVAHSTSLLSSSIYMCLCGRRNHVQTASRAEQLCISRPSIFTNASQVLGTAGLTLISLKYLFHPSSEQIEQKHWRLFQASANALETSWRQNPRTSIHSLGLQFGELVYFFLSEWERWWNMHRWPIERINNLSPFTSVD